ncbi:small heat shock-like protein [Bacillus phage Mgbh1]|uniref:Small heat shock-like protein n=1 Tax=Bacillus phage Mgbh1 TaxID=1796993 RepID=A0A142F1S6_9CAUD|nr:small heat shock-like protein [Bacillus phage Mgbh1]AMQ66733.1 small heat shock-like protein [Bacillus phage Mgbh1]
MKLSYKTGKQIYTTLAKLYEEANELIEALEMIGDDMGRDTKAYEILNTNLKAKREEIERHEKQNFTME